MTGAVGVTGGTGAVGATSGREARITDPTPPRPRRVVGLVDTDSFAKWGAHLLDRAPAHWQLELLTLATPRSASPGQLRAAFRGLGPRLATLSEAPPRPLHVDVVVQRLAEDPPDVVLVSCIGPVAELVIEEVVRRIPRRPVLLTGLPGISYPAKWKGVFLRARADLFVLHSHREVRAYEELAREGGLEPAFALATLPFIAGPRRPLAARLDVPALRPDPDVPALHPDPERAKPVPDRVPTPHNSPAHEHAPHPNPERAESARDRLPTPHNSPAHEHASHPNPERAESARDRLPTPHNSPAHEHASHPNPERADSASNRAPTPHLSPAREDVVVQNSLTRHGGADVHCRERAESAQYGEPQPHDSPARASGGDDTGASTDGNGHDTGNGNKNGNGNDTRTDTGNGPGDALGPGRRDSVVFAAQPSVPATREERAFLIRRLAETARAHPEWRVVIKVRATSGEHQTHHEEHPYAELLPVDAPPNLVVESGPMAEHLARAVALVTVSSTAVLEAVAAGVPALTLTDFGVSRQLINEVFVGSGLPGDTDDLVAGRFRTVESAWLRDNGFHPPSDDDWARRAEGLMLLRDAGALEDRPAARRSRGGALRRAWERKNALGRDDRSAMGSVALMVGTPVRWTKRVVRKVIRASRPEPEPVGSR
ncbi:hypothetical protein Csp2054_11670 [Curtobacterium sp. 'Ferrero']|uniref:DUF6716 putative glycosyltransferase n=1 Tax=Curtobacterium sp. 'Ferrero' TaxID=2033654 RepID=UPI000BDDC43F|nr:DUF6716 putative glycosyltransferase [Curtobacterium sp. 'Ferrero']PCN47525.1 hypothetical protein Csp2054_11670 [Curtobacterium sp. 'Ferrero']